MVQSAVCLVRNCHTPVYDGSFGPPGFVQGDTNMCKEHYFEWITMHDTIITELDTPRHAIRDVGELDEEEIRDQALFKNPNTGNNPEIPWFRPQHDNEPWSDTYSD